MELEGQDGRMRCKQAKKNYQQVYDHDDKNEKLKKKKTSRFRFGGMRGAKTRYRGAGARGEIEVV